MKQPLIHEYRDLIILLAKLSPLLRNKIIRDLKRKELDSISEIFSNFLKKKLTTDLDIVNQLRKYHRDIYEVALKKTTLSRKKKLLLTKRGGSILTILLPLAASLITKLVS